MRTKTLYVEESTILGAGRGLFANRSFREGELICYLKGKLLSNSYVRRKKNWGTRGLYLVDLGEKTLDTWESNSLGKFANDAEGLTKMKGVFNNSEFVRCSNNEMVYIRALRPIKAGEEILVGYGEEYWGILS
jgi:SET domain-containing protein